MFKGRLLLKLSLAWSFAKNRFVRSERLFRISDRREKSSTFGGPQNGPFWGPSCQQLSRKCTTAIPITLSSFFEVTGVKKHRKNDVFMYGLCPWNIVNNVWILHFQVWAWDHLNMASGRLPEVPQGSLRHHFGHHLGVWGAPEAAFWEYQF